MIDAPVLRDLGNDLVLRRAVPADTDALVRFNSQIHSDDGPDQPDEKVGVWTRDLMSGSHPLFQPGDFTIVEDSKTGQIVSSMNLISQTWSYAGVQIGVGRPELVGTLPEYRRRGLVRAQFDLVHEWSRQRGELLLAITGIPNYYRQFGYEMTVNLGGGRIGFGPQLPVLPEGEAELYILRPAVETDLSFIQEVYDFGRQRSLLSAVWTSDLWKHELDGKSPLNVNRIELRVIERPAGERVGIVGHVPFLWGPSLAAILYELKPGQSWLDVTPAVLRYLWKTGQEYAARDEGTHSAFSLWLEEAHPVYAVAADRLPRVRQPYAFFMRVPHLPAFLTRIAPVLEERLAASVCAGYSGDLKISFYRGGVKLQFKEGLLSGVAPWESSPEDRPGASFPGLTFYHVLLGYRSFSEVKYLFPDCQASEDRVRPLLEVLFPRQPSDVLLIS